MRAKFELNAPEGEIPVAILDKMRAMEACSTA
jgi:hypothetical protein